MFQIRFASLVASVFSAVALVVSILTPHPSRLSAQVQPPEVEWRKTYGGTEDDWGSSVQQTTDGGYIVAGRTRSFGAGNYDVYLIKTGANGNVGWSKTFGGAGHDWGSSVQQTTDGGYIVVGMTYSFGAGDYDVYLIKTDANGNLVWQKTFGGAGEDWATSVKQTTDGGYIVAGSTNLFDSGDYDVYLIKTGANGNVAPGFPWTFGGAGDDWGSSVQQTTDGGYIVAGRTRSFGAGNYDVYLIKTGASGNVGWSKTFGGEGYDFASSVQQTTDGGYIVAGSTDLLGAGGGDVYLIKTDANGNVAPGFPKTFGGDSSDFAYSVQQTTDGGYIVAGETYLIGASRQVYLIKTDANGNVAPGFPWTFGDAGDDWASSVKQTTDGGYIVAGTTDSFGAGNDDVYLIKLGPKVEYPFVRGDASADGRIDITDAIVTLNWLFVDSSIPICVDAADFDDGGEVDLSDPVAALNFLFLGTAPPKPPFPGVGFDPTPDDLNCNLKRP